MDKKVEIDNTPFDVIEAFKSINARAAERKAKRDAERVAANEERKKRMSKKTTSKGSSIQGLQGLQTRFGGKIV